MTFVESMFLKSAHVMYDVHGIYHEYLNSDIILQMQGILDQFIFTLFFIFSILNCWII